MNQSSFIEDCKNGNITPEHVEYIYQNIDQNPDLLKGLPIPIMFKIVEVAKSYLNQRIHEIKETVHEIKETVHNINESIENIKDATRRAQACREENAQHTLDKDSVTKPKKYKWFRCMRS